MGVGKKIFKWVFLTFALIIVGLLIYFTIFYYLPYLGAELTPGGG